VVRGDRHALILPRRRTQNVTPSTIAAAPPAIGSQSERCSARLAAGADEGRDTGVEGPFAADETGTGAVPAGASAGSRTA
jgi:hypothetical protein